MFAVQYLYMGIKWSQTLEARDKIRQAKLKQYEGHSRLVKCQRCGKEYKIALNRFLNGRGKYCSKECQYEDRKGLRVAVSTEFKKGQKPWNYQENKLLCKQCGKEFISPKCNERIFCSNNCLIESGYTLMKCEICLKEIKIKRSVFLKGRRFCSKKCQGIFFSGENSINWKGGITPINEKLRRTNEYKKWREDVYKRDNYTCQSCGIRGGKLAADHIKPFALYPELRTVLNNGRTLCINCHFKTDTYGGKKKIK